MNKDLKPCPFCGGGETRIEEQTYWTGMRPQLLSVSVKHWCEKNPLQSHIEIKAKTRDDAIKAWNTRATNCHRLKALDSWNWLKSLALISFNDEGFNKGVCVDAYRDAIKQVEDFLNGKK